MKKTYIYTHRDISKHIEDTWNCVSCCYYFCTAPLPDIYTSPTCKRGLGGRSKAGTHGLRNLDKKTGQTSQLNRKDTFCDSLP